MADILLLPGTLTQLTITSSPVSGGRHSSEIVDLAVDDATAHPDEVIVTVEATDGGSANSVNVFVSQGDYINGTFNDLFDGTVATSSTPTAEQLRNLSVPRSLIMQGTAAFKHRQLPSTFTAHFLFNSYKDHASHGTRLCP